MVDLMGGRFSQGYRMFQELTVKAFLAIRPHAAQLVDTVHLMLETGLPSFKGEPTIKRLRDRFRLDLSEERAAEYMVGVIKNAHENKRSLVYDECELCVVHSGSFERQADGPLPTSSFSLQSNE
jgi:phosphatidylinositol 4-kinase